MIDIYDYNEIGYNLQCFHEIFYKFWRIGSPVFTDEVKTCQIFFDKQGEQVQFKFNPDFWESLDNYERAYYIAHECLHAILNHGKRASLHKHKESKDISVDIVVNNILTKNLRLFKTDKIQEHNIFIEDLEEKRGLKLERNRSVEHYYTILKEQDLGGSGDNGQGVDGEGNQENDLPVNDHSYLGEDSKNIIAKAFGLEKDDVKDEDQKEAEQKCQEGGTGSLDKVFEVFNVKTYKVPNFQFLFKAIVKSRREYFEREANKVDWVKIDRRTVLLENDILLPNYCGEKPKDKIDMWFFQDISGSCLELKDKFISLARKIPPKLFNIKYHTFDTSVREIPITTKELVGGGGTDFQCIEEYILREVKNKGIKYPKVIVHLTDGYSYRPIQPQHPKNHYWLLTPNYTDGYIPKESFRLILDKI